MCGAGHQAAQQHDRWGVLQHLAWLRPQSMVHWYMCLQLVLLLLPPLLPVHIAGPTMRMMHETLSKPCEACQARFQMMQPLLLLSCTLLLCLHRCCSERPLVPRMGTAGGASRPQGQGPQHPAESGGHRGTACQVGAPARYCLPRQPQRTRCPACLLQPAAGAAAGAAGWGRRRHHSHDMGDSWGATRLQHCLGQGCPSHPCPAARALSQCCPPCPVVARQRTPAAARSHTGTCSRAVCYTCATISQGQCAGGSSSRARGSLGRLAPHRAYPPAPRNCHTAQPVQQQVCRQRPHPAGRQPRLRAHKGCVQLHSFSASPQPILGVPMRSLSAAAWPQGCAGEAAQLQQGAKSSTSFMSSGMGSHCLHLGPSTPVTRAVSLPALHRRGRHRQLPQGLWCPLLLLLLHLGTPCQRVGR
jgi:hypothetical protein